MLPAALNRKPSVFDSLCDRNIPILGRHFNLNVTCRMLAYQNVRRGTKKARAKQQVKIQERVGTMFPRVML